VVLKDRATGIAPAKRLYFPEHLCFAEKIFAETIFVTVEEFKMMIRKSTLLVGALCLSTLVGCSEAGNVVDSAKDQAGNVATATKDKAATTAKDATAAAKDKAAGAAGAAKDVAGAAKDKAAGVAGAAKDKVASAAASVGGVKELTDVISETKAAVTQGDMAAAQASFGKFSTAWESVSSTVKNPEAVTKVKGAADAVQAALKGGDKTQALGALTTLAKDMAGLKF
jgi:hypothetical protein